MALVRTRFAPSPSGFLHLGNARTALFAFLYARKTNGRFILRIEDTDQERLVPGSEASIYEDLKWLNLNWDEGPDIGGPLGPYRCSERYDVYKVQLKRLQKATRVYRCFCTTEQLDQDRALLSSQKKLIKYVGRCLNISDAESEKRAATENFVWRMHIPPGDPVVVNDVIRGKVEMSRDVIGDFVLGRASGVPVFLFANAIDDAVQEMTHVIRGEDHLSNTFRQVLIYQALGHEPPVFVHLPMIGSEGGGKLSKREGSLSIGDLRKEGFIPAGILNYLALLGWSPGDTAQTGEKFSLKELSERFDLERVHKGRALFDYQKLRFLNQQHLNDLSLEELAKLAPPRKPGLEGIWKDAIALVRQDAATLEELYRIDAFLAAPDLKSSPSATTILKGENPKKALQEGLSLFEKAVAGNQPAEVALKESIQAAGKTVGIKGKDLFFPFRVALTGVEAGPELVPLAKILGSSEIISRLKNAIEFTASNT
ncbi:MAG: glutamyl-tRNA synthetase [Bacteriovoracaceae bacterium]|nr:glutamyl-tRNA synthetase [Bacteriovoracaceae bacterium]